MNKHTPGPWFLSVSDHPGGLLIKPIPGQVVAQCDQVPEMEANARLIAAAPSLLQALVLLLIDVESSVDYGMPFESPEHGFHESVMAARAAIAKATGEK